MRSIRGRMIRQDRASAFFFTTLITVIIFMPISIQGQQSEVCCTEKEFDLFLIGEPDEGILSPFYSDLESDAKEVKVTSSIGGEVKIATWDVIWQTEGEYEAGTWSFSIPYKLEGATGFTLNATLELKVGGNTYEGSLNMPDILITGEGILEIPIDIVQGQISEGDNLEVTLSVQNLVFSSPGEDTGIFFLWGSEEYEGSITVKLPLIEIIIKEASVIGNLAYLPVMIKSGFDNDMWSKSEGGAKVQNIEISEKPIAILRENGVEVTFVWEIPDNSDGIIKFKFELSPQPGLTLESNKTHEIVVGEDSGNSDWYPENEPLRDGGSSIEVDIDSTFKGNEVKRLISIEFDGAMSQWIRWGLDNIGNSTLDSNSWWKNLNSYSDSIKSSEKHNGKVDDSEILALKSHLVGSRSDLKSFFANGLYLEIESIIGIDPVELGPTEININMGKTRAFNSEEIIITLETTYTIEEDQRQILVENFIRPSADKYWDEISLNIVLKTNILTGLGDIYADEIDYTLRRWIIMEAITIEENNLDSDLEFRIEFVPPSSFFFSPLVSAMISVLALSVALVIGMALTKRRARVPTMITVLVLGLLAFSIYWMGLPLQIVLGIVSTSVLLVFPISLVSPSSTTMDKISKKIGGPHVKCPSCGKSNQVQSTVRPLRMPCSDCNSILRLES
jgi:hypothetical protein|tara:strand:+ start:3409 stop:5433 length:2025 start_codon:yes stop_codon:yes gene_type:complete